MRRTESTEKSVYPPVEKIGVLILTPETGGSFRQCRENSHMRKNKKIGGVEVAEKKSDILKSVREQLEKKEADISVFNDLLDDYMALYDIKKLLKTDIKKRGVSYETTSASGNATIIKQNQSVKDLVAVNKQMLMILDKLGLTTEKTIKDESDEKL